MKCNSVLNIFQKKEPENKQEIIVVISFAYFGDSLVGNSLFQNIKRIYPHTKVVTDTKPDNIYKVCKNLIKDNI